MRMPRSVSQRWAMLLLLCPALWAHASVYDLDGGDMPALVWDGRDGDVDDGAFLVPYNVSSDWSGLFNSNATSVVDLAFKMEEFDLFARLGALISNITSTLVGQGRLANATLDGWTMVSVVALMPLRCADVDRAVAAFNAALQTANPGANVSSTARRLGAQACTPGGICPCQRDARARALEIRSAGRGERSPAPPDQGLLPFPLVRWRAGAPALA